MKIGGVRLLSIPSDLGVRPAGQPPAIAPDEALVLPRRGRSSSADVPGGSGSERLAESRDQRGALRGARASRVGVQPEPRVIRRRHRAFLHRFRGAARDPRPGACPTRSSSPRRGRRARGWSTTTRRAPPCRTTASSSGCCGSRNTPRPRARVCGLSHFGSAVTGGFVTRYGTSCIRPKTTIKTRPPARRRSGPSAACRRTTFIPPRRQSSGSERSRSPFAAASARARRAALSYTAVK